MKDSSFFARIASWAHGWGVNMTGTAWLIEAFATGIVLGIAVCGLIFWLVGTGMNEPTDEPALAGETKLEACEIEVRTLKEMYSAKLQEAAECDALLKNALLDCGAKAEAEARMMEEAESSLSSLPAGTY